MISIGYPGPALHNRPIAEPPNLAPGWVGFRIEHVFGRTLKLINDAAMQALGSYEGRKMLFLGLGTGLGSAMVIDWVVEPMELGHLPYKKGTYENYVGLRGLEKFGKKKWQRHVADVVPHLPAALLPDDVVLGGGNVKKLTVLPQGCRAGDNANAFRGGFRPWEQMGEYKLLQNPPMTTDSPRMQAREMSKRLEVLPGRESVASQHKGELMKVRDFDSDIVGEKRERHPDV